MADRADHIKAIIHNCKDHTLSLESQAQPTPSPSQYLVRVHAVGITKDELLWLEPHELPAGTAVPGFDVAGVVLKAPSPSSRFQPGDRVYAITNAARAANAREITLIEESEIAGIPDILSCTEAAALPMSALTAAEALFEKGDFAYEAASAKNRDRSVLIIGASGAVGIWAVQLAKWAGIGRIAGVCGSKNVDFVKSLGAHVVIDHSKESLRDHVKSGGEDSKFDLALDGVGGRMQDEAWTAVKAGGQLLSIVQPIDESAKPADGVSEGVRTTFFIVDPSGAKLEKIASSIEQGAVKPIVDSVYAFKDFQKAFDHVATGRARGKVILKMPES